MDSLDGMLLVPPDRSQILGRALWKLRYVVVGRPSSIGSQRDHQSSPSYSQFVTTSRSNSCSKTLSRLPNEDYFLVLFKHKDDSEPVQQWSINSITDCQVQVTAYRKQGPSLPTLILTLTDKERKRRSSRAAGLISSGKDPNATTLWFRTPPDDHHPSLHDWARFIMSKKIQIPMSPDSPMSPQFSNPFSPISRDPSDHFPRPSSGNQSNRSDGRGLQHKTSNHTYSTSIRERPLTFSSESISLRSKRSDVSSPSLSNYPSHPIGYPIPGQHYTTVLPTDLPSPITTAGDYQGEFIEGWTSAQGRSSTMSSPIRGRDSVGSHAHQQSMMGTDSSSPPGPRETILDRAFQMRYIPGTESEIPGEEKLSSMARFEALMRDADEKRKQREAAERAQQVAMRSAFEASDSSEEELEKESDSEDDDNFADEHDRRVPPLIPPTTQRALQFIASRHESLRSPNTSRPGMSRNSSSFQADPQMATLTQEPPTRPHTAHAKSRLNSNQRSYSTPQLSPAMANLELADQGSDDGTIQGNADKRQSNTSTSTKRLSFSEFTKRLSSSSSLLLVQTNTSGGSSRRSSEIDIHSSSVSRPRLISRGPGPGSASTRDRERDDYDKRCGWRGSVGVVNNEGGFL